MIRVTLKISQFSHSVMCYLRPQCTAARQASLSITNSRSLFKLMSIESVMPSNHLTLCRPLLFPPSIFPNIRVFSCESILRIRWPSIGASVSVLPVNIKDLFPLGLTGWIFFCPKDSQESSPTPQFEKYQFFSAQPFLWPTSHIHNMTTVKSIALTIWTFVGKVMSAF